jgi:hypothetical protein
MPVAAGTAPPSVPGWAIACRMPRSRATALGMGDARAPGDEPACRDWPRRPLERALKAPRGHGGARRQPQGPGPSHWQPGQAPRAFDIRVLAIANRGMGSRRILRNLNGTCRRGMPPALADTGTCLTVRCPQWPLSTEVPAPTSRACALLIY